MHAATDQQPVTAARTRTVLALVCALAAGPLAAQVKISGLPAATTPLVGTEALPCVQSGVTAQCTANALGALTAPNAITQVAAVYVTTTGNDALNCLTWGTACATITHAIAVLPANGGTVEVGYGTFACPAAISGLAQQQLRIRGRGIGNYYVGGANRATTATSSDPTRLTYSSGNCIQATGQSINNNDFMLVLEDFAIQGLPSTAITFASGPPGPLSSSWGGTTGNYVITLSTNQSIVALLTNGSTAVAYTPQGIQGTPTTSAQYSTTSDGINITNVTHLVINRVVTKFNGRYGLNITSGSYWTWIDQLHAQGNAQDGFFATGSNTANAFLMRNSKLQNNGLNGAEPGPGNAMSFVNDDFSDNGTSIASAQGNGLKFSNGGPYNVLGCWFEDNLRVGIQGGGSSAFNVVGSFFTGDNVTQYGIAALDTSDILNVTGNSFVGHSAGGGLASIDNGQGQLGIIQYNVSADTNFLFRYNGTQNNGSAGHVPGSLASGVFQNNLIATQSLGSAGAVTIDASKVAQNGYQQITLAANATSSSITNPTVGQTMTVQWIENATGGFTYAWPANTKFTGGAAPAGTTLSTMNGVTFNYNGTNWIETSRSTSVPAP